MTPRAIRRAAERKANKLARKVTQHLAPSDAYATENRLAEIQFPAQEPAAEAPAKTPEITIPPAAAANANLCAVTSALTGYATLLPTADAAQYGQLLGDYQNEFQPAGPQESNLVQSLAEIAWRMRRCVTLEMAIFAKGRLEFAEQFAEHNPDLRESLIDVHTFLVYEKQIRGLQLQEARLSRRADKDSAELRRLQQERQQREEQAHRQQQQDKQRQLEAAAQLYQAAQQNHQPFDPGQNGFEFSNYEIASYLTRKQEAQDRFAATLGLPMHAKAA